MHPLLRLTRAACRLGFAATALPAAGFLVAVACLNTIERRSAR